MKTSKPAIKTILLIICFLLTSLNLYSTEKRTVEKVDRKMLRKLEKSLASFKRSLIGNFLESFFFRTGIYAALINNETIIINRRPVKIETKSNKILKIITANLYLFPPPLLSEQKKRIAYFVNSIRKLNPDIILLQEVWDKTSILEIARLLPEYNLSFKSSQLYNKSGLLTLCKYKILQSEFVAFPLSLQHKIEELLAQKGFLKINIEVGGQKIAVFNTHLYSSAPWHAYRPTIKQVRILQDFVIKYDNKLKILGGDFNLKPREISELVGKEFLRGSCNLPTAGGIKRTKKLDYLMVISQKSLRTRIATRRLETKEMFSDHSAVFGRIIFSNP